MMIKTKKTNTSLNKQTNKQTNKHFSPGGRPRATRRWDKGHPADLHKTFRETSCGCPMMDKTKKKTTKPMSPKASKAPKPPRPPRLSGLPKTQTSKAQRTLDL